MGGCAIPKQTTYKRYQVQERATTTRLQQQTTEKQEVDNSIRQCKRTERACKDECHNIMVNETISVLRDAKEVVLKSHCLRQCDQEATSCVFSDM